MISNTKTKIKLALIFAAVLAIGIFVWHTNRQVPDDGTPIVISKEPKVYSMNGTVKSIEGIKYTLLLSDGKTQKDFAIYKTTPVVRRSGTKSNPTLIQSQPTSIKVGSSVIVYSSTDPANATLAVSSRVEIIE